MRVLAGFAANVVFKMAATLDGAWGGFCIFKVQKMLISLIYKAKVA